MNAEEKKTEQRAARARATTARHQAIADVANELLEVDCDEREPYTAADVRRIFAAWQEEYMRRKQTGQIKPSPHNRWRAAATTHTGPAPVPMDGVRAGEA